MGFIRKQLTEEEGNALYEKYRFENTVLGNQPVKPTRLSEDEDTKTLLVLTSPGGNLDNPYPEKYALIVDDRKIEFGININPKIENKQELTDGTSSYDISYSVAYVTVPKALEPKLEWTIDLVKKAINHLAFADQNPNFRVKNIELPKPMIIED